MTRVISFVFNKILKLLAHMTFYSVSAVIGYAAGYKRLKKYNNNNNNNNNNINPQSAKLYIILIFTNLK